MSDIINIEDKYFANWLDMGLKLWPHETNEELEKIFKGIIESEKEECFIYIKDGIAIGFINVSIRNDYVNGCNSSPVGYIEGIFVEEEYRNQGIAKSLVKTAEKWSQLKGCIEMGSDILIDNIDSYSFHKKLGFKEAERVICFAKYIDV